MGCEGSDEVEFMRYLISLYSLDPTNPKLINGGGGKPIKIVKAVRKLVCSGAYAHRYALIDNDRNAAKMQAAIDAAKERPEIALIVAENRFECELLRIKGVPARILTRAIQNSSVAKEEFARICDRTRTGSDKSYDKVFPKSLLDYKRSTSAWLDGIIRVIEDGNKFFVE